MSQQPPTQPPRRSADSGRITAPPLDMHRWTLNTPRWKLVYREFGGESRWVVLDAPDGFSDGDTLELGPIRFTPGETS